MKITFNSKWRINANEATPALNKKESEIFEEKMVEEEKKECSSIDKKSVKINMNKFKDDLYVKTLMKILEKGITKEQKKKIKEIINK